MKIKLTRKINNLRIRQSRLPVELHDYSEYDQLIQDLIEVENKKLENIYAKIYFRDLVVIYCGNYLMYGRIAFNDKGGKKAKKQEQTEGEPTPVLNLNLQKFSNGKYFKEMACNFSSEVEVINVLETSKPGHLQVVTQESATGLLQVLTWDFEQNIEDNMF